MNLKLNKRNALVIAASKGIGRGVAMELARENCDVTIASSNKKHIKSAISHILSESGRRVSGIEIDIRSKKSINEGLESVFRKKGKIDILVTNSPGPPPGLMTELNDNQIKKGVEANLMSIIWLCKKVLPKMKEMRYGRIINLSSTVAKEIEQGMGLSSLTRAGALAFCKTIAHENAKYGITVNSILTGGVLSDRTKDLLTKEAERSGVSLDDMYANASQRIPAGYISTPKEFAQMVVFLCSERASYVTGASIPLDGGFMASI
jgi:3-oxoacyl-[acyl-carrier protein] reductase